MSWVELLKNMFLKMQPNLVWNNETSKIRNKKFCCTPSTIFVVHAVEQVML